MMSKAAELNEDGHENVTNGSLEKQSGDAEPVGIEGDEGEESDDYEEIEEEEERQIAEEEEEEEDEGEEAEQQGPNTLTHLLLGNTNGATAENEAEYEEYEDDVDQGDEDEDDDDEYVEDDEEDAAPPNPLTKKRSIDEVADEEASHGSKKIKA